MKHNNHLYFIIICCLIFSSVTNAQNSRNYNKTNSFFIQPELLFGKAIASNSNFPETDIQRIFALSLGRYVQDTSNNWSVFYNYPSVGVTLSYSHFGNSEAFGNAYTLLPFITLSPSKKLKNSFYFKVGLGASYFTTHYHKENNPNNLAIGSSVTWTFQSTIHYNLYVAPLVSIGIGGGFIHHSNGHTQLPNLGLNSLLFSISSRFYLKPLNNEQLYGLKRPQKKRERDYFISARSGFGYHELGGAKGSIDDKKRIVQSLSVSGGTIINRLLKVSVGLTYRYYQQYYNYLNLYQSSDLSKNAFWNSSNIFVFLGCELFIGHTSMDTELGINLFKPFYEEFDREFEDDSEFSYKLKSTFATRLGLKVYAVNMNKKPKNNVYIGVHINANFGQADFSELSIGYLYRFGPRRNNGY